MKSLFLSLTLLLLTGGVLHAQGTDKSSDLTTLSGKTYKQARVFRVEPDGINYMFAGGMVKVPFTDLPEAIRKANGYNPQMAASYAAADNDAQATLAYSAAAANEQEAARSQTEKQNTAIIEKVMPLIEASRLTGDFRVSQVLEDGFLAYPDGWLTAADGKKQSLPGPIYIVGYATDALTDDAVVKLTVYLAGTHKYVTTMGAGKTIARYAASKEVAFQLCKAQFSR